jgi:S1-C subfamily serine protease
VITSVAGRSVSTQAQLQAAILARKPGDRIQIAVSDGYGSTQTITVTLATGPAA